MPDGIAHAPLPRPPATPVPPMDLEEEIRLLVGDYVPSPPVPPDPGSAPSPTAEAPTASQQQSPSPALPMSDDELRRHAHGAAAFLGSWVEGWRPEWWVNICAIH